MYRILLVDDQPDMHRLVEHHLASKLGEPYVMEIVGNEEDAIAAVGGSDDYDVVLLDLCLPEFTGLEVLGKLLTLRPNLAVVVVSGQGSERVVVEALERGAMSYIDKSSLAEMLPQTVRKVVSVSRETALRRRISSGMTAARFSYELESDPGLIPALLDEVREVFAKFQIGGPNPAQLLIAIEEALANALYHGNLEIGSELKQEDFRAFYKLAQETRKLPAFRDRRVRLHLEVREGTAWVTVCDDGEGFDPDTVPDPTLPENLDKSFGRGLLLMRAFFDEVVFSEKGNEVTLVAAAVPDGHCVAPSDEAVDPETKGKRKQSAA
ncbi:ATP-binding protein [Phycisphaeraceae bacterium D3-23]